MSEAKQNTPRRMSRRHGGSFAATRSSSSVHRSPDDDKNQASDTAGSPSKHASSVSSFEVCEALSECFANSSVFEQVSSEVDYACAALDRRILSLEDSSDQLTLACKRYVKRFAKRMEILEKKGGTSHRGTLGVHWAVKMRTFLEKPFANRNSFILYVFISLLIVISCVLVILQTIPRFNPFLFPQLENTWLSIEVGLGIIFLIEILARFIAFTCDPTTKAWYLNARDFFFSASNAVDFGATVLPTVFQFYGQSHPLISVCRLLRLFRIFFMLRHFDAFEDLEETLKKSLPSLSGPLIGLLVAITGFASIIFALEVGSYNMEGSKRFMVRNEDCELTAGYVLEKALCDRKESKFISVVHTMWFVLITFLTVGYGDLVPLTMMGRFFGSCAAISGSLFMAMPIAIVGTSFTLVVARLKSERRAAKVHIEREQLRSETGAAKLQKDMGDPPALPSLAFCRFLRLALKEDMLFFAAATRKAVFFIDLFLLRVVDSLLDPTRSRFLMKRIWTRKRTRKPYTCRLVLSPSYPPPSLDKDGASLHPDLLSLGGGGGTNWPQQGRVMQHQHQYHHQQHALVRGVPIAIGTSEFAPVRLWSALTQATLQRMVCATANAAAAATAQGLATAAGGITTNISNQQVVALQEQAQHNVEAERKRRQRYITTNLQKQHTTAEKLISDHHADLTLVTFGGAHADKVYAEPIAHYATLLEDERLLTRKEVRSGDVLRFDPTCAGAGEDKVTVEFEYGVRIEPFASVHSLL